MNPFGDRLSTREAAIGGLAAIGFITLVGASIWLAVSATRFVPHVVNRIGETALAVVNRAGEAAVSVGSFFTPTKNSFLSIIPDPTLIPFEEVTSIPPITTATSSTIAPQTIPKPSTPIAPKKIVQTAGLKTTKTIEISGATTTTKSTATLSGLPDFIVTITATGYLATNSADSFVATSTIPSGSRPAVKFNIKNIGTNASGSWRFSASIPTQNSYVYQSYSQQPLAPGDSIDYTLGFDQANKGSGKTISIIANFDNTVSESNMSNNSTSTQITILGS